MLWAVIYMLYVFRSSRLYNQYNVLKAIKCQLKMRADMGGNGTLAMLEYVYSQPIISGYPKQVTNQITL